MPINYIDPTADDTDALADLMFADVDSDEYWDAMDRFGTKKSGDVRTDFDWSDRKQAYTLGDIVKGLAGGGDQDLIINNITQAGGTPLEPRKTFMKVLESWETALPLNDLWMVFFKIPDMVRDEVMGAWGEHVVQINPRSINNPLDSSSTGLHSAGGIDAAKRLLTKDKFMRVTGCAFAQTVQTPPEQVGMDQVGIPGARGFIAGPVITQRQRFSSLNIEFLETNVSFVDFLIRPWAILGSHFGAMARSKEATLHTDILLINLSRAGYKPAEDYRRYDNGHQDWIPKNDRGFVPRKMWLFHGCQPINISQERYSYSAGGDIDRRDTEWMFKRYQILLPSQMEATFNQIEEEDSAHIKPSGKAVKGSSQNAVDLHEKNRVKYTEQQNNRNDKWSVSTNRDKFWKSTGKYKHDEGLIGSFIEEYGNDEARDIGNRGRGQTGGALNPKDEINPHLKKAEKAAADYWDGKDVISVGKQSTDQGNAKWSTVNGQTEAPHTETVNSKPEPHVGWDHSDGGGQPRGGASGKNHSVNHKYTQRPYGIEGATGGSGTGLADGLILAEEVARMYGEGTIRHGEWNVDRDLADDYDISGKGVGWMKEVGPRYNTDKSRNYIARPYGSKSSGTSPTQALDEAYQTAWDYGSGAIEADWNPGSIAEWGSIRYSAMGNMMGDYDKRIRVGRKYGMIVTNDAKSGIADRKEFFSGNMGGKELKGGDQGTHYTGGRIDQHTGKWREGSLRPDPRPVELYSSRAEASNKKMRVGGYAKTIQVGGRMIENPGKPFKNYSSRTDILSLLFGI